MKYLGCQGCSNNATVDFLGKKVNVCMGNVNNRVKCTLRKRVLNPDIAEFFEATCERYRDESKQN